MQWSLSMVLSALAGALTAYLAYRLTGRSAIVARVNSRVLGFIEATESALLAALPDQEEKELRRDTKIGLRLCMIGALLPVGQEWRIEEMKNHRNELRAEMGRVPRFHYVRLFLSTLEIRWEARVYPERRVD